METLLNCHCVNAEVIRYVNSVVMDTNHKLVELDQFNITPNCVNSLNACLVRHGFKGSIKVFNNSYAYIGDFS